MSRVNISTDQLTPELNYQFAKSGGPGGQHVNKTNTKVSLSWNVLASGIISPEIKERLSNKLKLTKEGDLIVYAQGSRSQLQNKQEALEKLVFIINQALYIPKKRRPTKRTKGSIQRRLTSKKHLSNKKSNRKKPI
jgi:ribosome-associated protein